MPWISLSLLFLNLLVFAINVVEYRSRQAILGIEVQGEDLPGVHGYATLALLTEVFAEDSTKSALAGGDRGCLLIGPYSEAEHIDALMADMSFEGLPSTRFVHDIVLAPDYWVLIPPYEDISVANKRAEMLRSEGIDSFVIAKGKYRNGVSLGLFHNRDLADQFQERRVRDGIAATVIELPRTRREFWALVQGEHRTSRAEHILTRHVLTTGNRISSRKISCESVARRLNLP